MKPLRERNSSYTPLDLQSLAVPQRQQHLSRSSTIMKFRGADLLSRIAIGIAAIAAVIGGPALAASPDQPAAPFPAPVYTWTGFYVGGNLGYGGGDDRTGVAGNGSVAANIGGHSFPSGFAFANSDTASLN